MIIIENRTGELDYINETEIEVLRLNVYMGSDFVYEFEDGKCARMIYHEEV